MWSVARRPRWIAALVLALALAAGFAALSQWQLSRAVATGTIETRPTETVVPLDTIAKPQAPQLDDSDGQLVSVAGVWVPHDYVVLSTRLNHGASGFWVVGHFSAELNSGLRAGLPVAVGWAPTKKAATQAMDRLQASTVTTTAAFDGRYFVSEAPQDSDFEHGKLSTLNSGAMVNLWKTADGAGVYGGYLVAERPSAGLTKIYSPKPVSQVELNWLNIFYAAEWVVFAGFGIFLWYRLVRDAWEREQEEALEQAELHKSDDKLAEVN
ncbi:MAG: hypothetical protein JWO10_2182 [Microbacteriaceae bacterium]|nr:hypothetical protein [Microbacteriaceae bacterium]